MDSGELSERCAEFALRVMRMAETLPPRAGAEAIRRQVIRSGFSVAANYRAALRAKSGADFINKITIVLEEADETLFWLEMVERAALFPPAKLAALRAEADELVRIFSATRRTAKNHKS